MKLSEKIFGTHSSRELKRIMPLVDKIEELRPTMQAMTDEELAESDELLSGLCNVLHGQGYPCEANTCRECLIKWLGSPEKEAAPEPVTSGDRIRAMTAEELAERERLERLYEETRQIADRRAWDETSRTMAYNCGQEAYDGQ